MSIDTLKDKARKVTDLVQLFGDCLEGNPQENESVHDLRGAARVIVKRQGFRADFTILARGAEIHAGSWRGQFGTPEIVRGGEHDLERIARNADKMSARVKEARAAEAAEAGAPAPR